MPLCDFYTSGGNTAVPDAYVNALLRDMKRYLPAGTGQTRYIWRGHAGLLAPKQLAANFAGGRPGTGAEITLETNTDLATDRKPARAGGPRV